MEEEEKQQQKEGEEQRQEEAAEAEEEERQLQKLKTAMGSHGLLCRHPPCRAVVEMGQAGLFIVSSALATTQGMARLIEFRIQKLRSKRATNLYEHLSKDDAKEIKARMKDEWLKRPENKAIFEDLYASLTHHV